MSFPWLETTRPRGNGADKRAQVAAAEVAHRAGLLYRLGFTQDAAIARLRGRVAWELEDHRGAAQLRPDALSDAAIAKIVADTYSRRPG